MSVPGGWLAESSVQQRIASDGLPAVPTFDEVVRHTAGGSVAPPRRRGLAVLLTIVAVLVIVACGLAILVIIGQNTGTSGLLLGAVLALLPVPLLVGAVRWLDRYEPEPSRYLVLAFAWGAAVATLVAITLNTAGASLFPTPTNPADPGLAAVLVAPPVEELAKGAIVFYLAWRRRIDSVVDGMVFAALSALGFAFTENILYYGRAYAEISTDFGTGPALFGAIIVFVLRGVVSPFAHPLFTMSIGIGIGVAVRSNRRSVRVVAPLLGVVVAVGLHALWNGAATQGLDWFALSYLVIMLPVFAVGVGIALWFRRRQGRLLSVRLPAFAESGWIAPHEVAVIASLELRDMALDMARGWGGEAARDATREYQERVVALGFLRDRLARGRLGEAGLVEQVQLLATLPALRSQAYVPPPPVPLRQLSLTGPPRLAR